MRLFVALDLPPALRTRLSWLAGGLPGARWVPPENYHVTLRFIGEIQGWRAEEVDHALAGLRAPGFDLRLSGVGTFAKGGKVNALWVGVERNPALDRLQSKVENTLQRAGLEPERRRFQPHVTLARLDGVPEGKIAGWVQGHNLFRSDTVRVEHFTLFRSRLGKEQAVYEAEVEYPLLAYAGAAGVEAGVVEALLAEARACTHCADLPAGPRPILQASRTARLVIASQAPGSIAHASGVPFQDPSGVRLREWLGLDEEAFYDAGRVAILPMGLCYPGRHAQGGDLPPRPECAPRWRGRFLAAMPEVRLILLVGGYSQADALGAGRMTDRVLAYRAHLPRYFPPPHPSWRTGVWERRNPWFTAEVLPALKREVRRALDD